MDDLVGTMVGGRYAVLSQLGSGGMGTVYRAHDRELDEMVALKVIRGELARDERIRERFRHEVKLARRVTHTNIARTFELGSAGGLTYYTMELVEGESLRVCLRRRTRLPAGEAIAIALALCEGLAAAHAAGVIHRDIKPENVLLSPAGRVVLADFGIASMRVPDDDALVGTPAYMAPEQARGDAPTPAADVYAVALVLFELLTGRPAFDESEEEILAAKQTFAHVVVDSKDVAADIAHVIEQATKRDPINRVSTAAELHRRLSSCAGGQVVTPRTSFAGVADSATTLRSVLIHPPRVAETARSHVAYAIYEQTLSRISQSAAVRLQFGSAATSGEPVVVELTASESLGVSIRTSPDASPLELQLSLQVEQVAQAAATLASAIVASVDVHRVASVEAYELMLRARAIAAMDLATTSEPLALLELAERLAPEDPEIQVELACIEIRAAFSHLETDLHRLDRARTRVAAALALRPDSGAAQIAAGRLELTVGDPTIAATHFRAAIASSPLLAEAHAYMGRMLFEAGHVVEAKARIEHASSLDPRLEAPLWELSRLAALEGNWDDCYRILAGSSKVIMPHLRFAWWRHDLATLATYRTQMPRFASPAMGDVLALAVKTIVDDSWHANQAAIMHLTTASRSIPRRGAMVAQLTAELAAYFDDVDACVGMIETATDCGLFDLPWLERCPLLESVRSHPAVEHARARVKRRADAVLDALYGDYQSRELTDTVVL